MTSATYTNAAAPRSAAANPGEKSGLVPASQPFALPAHSVTVITATDK